ncbi:MAG: adenosine deaminase family protein [Deltaproteobacteria bacterium]|nr:adenosine deaminase family protein [Deltaproteobacteria bacterium]
MKTPITKAFLTRLPKSDLHLHLDGSLRLNTLIELARKVEMKLPSYTEEGLRELVFKQEYTSLEEYLRGFSYTLAVLQDPEALARVAFELACDNQAEGVRYIEVRLAPQLHAHGSFDTIEALRAVSDGLERAKRDFNAREEVRSGEEPPFDYGIISCSMRYFDEKSSPFHAGFLGAHRYSDLDRVFGLASLELVLASARARDEHGLPVVGVDLAGPEKGYPPIHHREAYLLAQRHFLRKTVHAGEAYGPESIYQAITELHAERIGHGTSLLNPAAVQDPDIADPVGYVADLARFIADRRITLEVCLTSNQQTNPSLRRLETHPFGEMMKLRLSICICTDNRTVSNTTVTDELYKAVTVFDLDLHYLKNLLVYGFKRSFFPGPYAEKRKYVRRCMDYFEKLEAEYLASTPEDDKPVPDSSLDEPGED